jgi:hypothetical protein
MLAHQCAEHISHQVGLIIDYVRSTDVAAALFTVGSSELDLMFCCQWWRDPKHRHRSGLEHAPPVIQEHAAR